LAIAFIHIFLLAVDEEIVHDRSIALKCDFAVHNIGTLAAVIPNIFGLNLKHIGQLTKKLTVGI